MPVHEKVGGAGTFNLMDAQIFFGNIIFGTNMIQMIQLNTFQL